MCVCVCIRGQSGSALCVIFVQEALKLWSNALGAGGQVVLFTFLLATMNLPAGDHARKSEHEAKSMCRVVELDSLQHPLYGAQSWRIHFSFPGVKQLLVRPVARQSSRSSGSPTAPVASFQSSSTASYLSVQMSV